MSAGDTAVYVESGDVEGFAAAVSDLLDDPDRRAEMAHYARERVAQDLDWEPQSQAYVSVFDRIFGVVRDTVTTAWPRVDRRHRSRPPVDALGEPAGRPAQLGGRRRLRPLARRRRAAASASPVTATSGMSPK